MKTTIFPPLCDVCKPCNHSERVSNTGKYDCIENHIPDANGNCKYREGEKK